MTNRSLGYACRFGTLEEVKSFVERGANLCLDTTALLWWTEYYVYYNISEEVNYSLALLDDDYFGWDGGTYVLSPRAEREKIAEYLLDRAKRVALNPECLLYYTLESKCEWLYALLKKTRRFILRGS